MRIARYAWVLGLAMVLGVIDRATATPADARVVTGIPIQTDDSLGVRIEAVAIHDVAGQPVLHGHVRSDAQAGLSVSRRIQIDVFDADGQLKSRAYERITTAKPMRPSRLKRQGGFSHALSGLEATDRVVVTVVRAELARAGK